MQCSPQAKFKACHSQGMTVGHIGHQSFWNLPIHKSKGNSVLKACWADMPYVCYTGRTLVCVCVCWRKDSYYNSTLARLSV